MNILIEPIYIGIIQAFISLILLSGFLFVGRLINSKIFINYNNLLFDLLISVIFLSQILKIFSYLNFFKETNFIFSGLFIGNFLNLINLLLLIPCQILTLFFANNFHGNFSPGTFFLSNAISECPKMFFFLM